ncbi:MAG TPA: sulfide/dihydroorotate dehydrogenase-like FAD/NAD-binding protein [Nocardioidaceae bacterium]|nr:sulfide/dihydroorotate dehydrogenase-like FAD/NAD-binding protein [Nocardioidaceae bacterium]
MDTTARIIETRDLTDVTKLFVVHAPLVARNAAPGQFVILRVAETGERIPISITDFSRADGTITIVVQQVGRTSALVCALEVGDTFLDFAGPLGLAVPLPDEGHAVLIGGGFGTGAVFPLARELRSRGVRVSSIVGARTRELVILDDLLATESDDVHLCTNDGSQGYRGFVTGRLEELMDQGAGFTHCFAVGPMPMMRAVADTAQRRGLPAMVSLDPLMVDGTGMCGGCRVSVGGKSLFACVHGPFFDAHEVDFDEADARLTTYKEQEDLACDLAGLGR